MILTNNSILITKLPEQILFDETLHERANRLIIRHDKYPDEFYPDILWALGLDKIIRSNIELIKNNAIKNFKKLEYNVAKDYKILKITRDNELYCKWYNSLTQRDKKLSEYLYSINFNPQELDKKIIRNILKMDSHSLKVNEILKSYNINDYSKYIDKLKIIHAFNTSRSKNGIDIFGTSGFGQLRPVYDSQNHGIIKITEIHTENYAHYFCGRRYIKYARLYENLKYFEKPIIIKSAAEWESKSNPLSSVINKYEFPDELRNQTLLVYTKSLSENGKNFPPVSTTLIFAKEKRKNTKPVLTAVLWNLASPKTFPEIQKYLETTYQKYLSIKNSPNTPEKKEKVINIIAEMQWIFHRMAPYKRGCAAMGDALARILMEAAGLKLDRWKIGILPDLETFVFDLKSYKQNYAQLFDSEPHFNINYEN